MNVSTKSQSSGDYTELAIQEKFKDPVWGADQLSEISIFKAFSKQELQTLYGRGEIITLNPGAHAVIEGENSRGVYFILSGIVSVFKNDITGTMHLLTQLKEGAHFGEFSLFDESPRSASVSSETRCEMFYLDITVFEQFLADSGSEAMIRFYKTCAIELSERFRSLNADYITSQQLLWKHALRRESLAPQEGEDSDLSNDANPATELDLGSDDA